MLRNDVRSCRGSGDGVLTATAYVTVSGGQCGASWTGQNRDDRDDTWDNSLIVCLLARWHRRDVDVFCFKTV